MPCRRLGAGAVEEAAAVSDNNGAFERGFRDQEVQDRAEPMQEHDHDDPHDLALLGAGPHPVIDPDRVHEQSEDHEHAGEVGHQEVTAAADDPLLAEKVPDQVPDAEYAARM